MSKIYPIRADESDRARWQECADRAGLSFNAWAVKALNSEVGLVMALERDPAQSDFLFRPDPKPVSTKKGRR